MRVLLIVIIFGHTTQFVGSWFPDQDQTQVLGTYLNVSELCGQKKRKRLH